MVAGLTLALSMSGAARDETKTDAATSSGSTTLTAMDVIEIRQLASRYAFALVTGSSNGYDFADLFTSDGECLQPYAKGREQLAALARIRLSSNAAIVLSSTMSIVAPLVAAQRQSAARSALTAADDVEIGQLADTMTISM